MITLQLIVMTRPNGDGIYSVSKLRPCKRVSQQEFMERYADNARAIKVSMNGGDPQLMTAYGYGLDCWYIVI